MGLMGQCITCKMGSEGTFLNDYGNCGSCQEKLERRAKEIWGSQGNPLDFIIESGGSVGYVQKSCQRCGKKFRFYRKWHTIYDKKAHKYHAWKQVCVDCINLKSDVF